MINCDLHLVESLDELDAFRRWLGERRPIMAVDIETTGLSLAKDKIRLVQFGDGQNGWALPYEDWRGAVREVLGTYEGPMVLQHAKFDASFLLKDGLPFPWERVHDTMFMSYLVNSMGPKSLKQAAAYYVDPSAKAGEIELKKIMAKRRWNYATVPITLPQYWSYAAFDTVITALLAEKLWPEVQQYREAYDLELACERVLCEMEMRGMPIDVPYCESELARLTDEWVDITEELGDLNPNAPKQIVEALRQQGAPLKKRTDSGQLSVDDEVLKSLQDQYPTAGLVLRARWNQKLRGSYFSNFIEYNADGVLHPHINQIAARTGRMSVTEPALQTIPREASVRHAFVSRGEGHKLLLCDYDNEELRVAAHFAQDEAMLSAFAEGRDLHGEAAQRIFGDGWTREQRGIAKAAMFAKAYGAGVPKFALATGLPEGEAARVFRGLDIAFPGLSRAMADVTLKIRERAGGDDFGWIALVDGRRLQIPADKPYVGFNHLVQGSCAVVLKRALVDLDFAGLGEYILLPIHDEVAFDVPVDQLKEVTREVQRVMTRKDFTAPLTVGAKIVDRWGDAYR